jgi:hypothetical protein
MIAAGQHRENFFGQKPTDVLVAEECARFAAGRCLAECVADRGGEFRKLSRKPL